MPSNSFDTHGLPRSHKALASPCIPVILYWSPPQRTSSLLLKWEVCSADSPSTGQYWKADGMKSKMNLRPRHTMFEKWSREQLTQRSSLLSAAATARLSESRSFYKWSAVAFLDCGLNTDTLSSGISTCSAQVADNCSFCFFLLFLIRFSYFGRWSTSGFPLFLS